MRESRKTLELKRGLRPFKKETRRAELLEECVNLRVRNEKLVEPQEIEWPDIVGVDPGFPHPQLRLCWFYTFLLDETTIYQVDMSDWTLTILFDGIIAGGIWHVADFGEFIVFSNGSVTICWPESYIEAPEFPETAIECFDY